MAHRPPLLSILFALAALLVAPVAAHGERARGGPAGEGGRGSHPGVLGPEVMEQLHLDELQQQLIQELREEMGDDLEPVREEQRELESQLEALWSAEFPDQEAILSLGEWLDVLHSVIRERRVELRLDVLDILSGEQRLLLAELTAADESRGGRDGRGGPEGRGRGGPPDQALERYGDDDGPDGADDFEEFGDSEPGDRNGRRGGGRVDLARKLHLDAIQRAELRFLRAEMRARNAPIREVMSELRQELKELWSTPWPDENAIYEVGEDIDSLRGLLREEDVEFRLALIEILTSEQRALFDEQRRDGSRGRGPGNPDSSSMTSM